MRFVCLSILALMVTAGCHMKSKNAAPTVKQGPGEGVVMAAGDIKWGEGPVGLPAGAQAAVIDGNPHVPGTFTMRAKLPANYKIPAHTHPQDEHVTVLSGALFIGMGDKLDESKGRELTAGGYFNMPAGHRHFAYTRQETVIQLHGLGPWGIRYVDPNDDPRKAAK